MRRFLTVKNCFLHFKRTYCLKNLKHLGSDPSSFTSEELVSLRRGHCHLEEDVDARRFLLQFEEIPHKKKELLDIIGQLGEVSEEELGLSFTDSVEDLYTDLKMLKEYLQAKLDVKRLRHSIAKFEIQSWPLFKETFENLIHKNLDLTNTEKVHYSIGSLSGKALPVCQAIPPTGEYYEIIWKALLSKFKDMKIIEHSHLEQLKKIFFSTTSDCIFQQFKFLLAQYFEVSERGANNYMSDEFHKRN